MALAVQGLRLSTPNSGGTGLIPSQGTKIPHAAQPKERRKKKKKGIHIHTHIIYIYTYICITNREGNGNPLQYSCLENPRDRGAWRAAVYGVAQTRTRLK